MYALVTARSGGVAVVACGVGTGVYVRVLARGVARYTAHGFTGHRLQRLFLTRRHATQVLPPRILAARRARQSAAPRTALQEPVFQAESERGWALASLALMVLVVVLACCAAGVRFH